MFTGEQRDADSGFYYLRARYYDPFLGRFITRDPLGEGNGYSYALNNPVNLIDPYGLFGCGDLGPAGGLCESTVDQVEAGIDAAGAIVTPVAKTVASVAAGCWQSTLCRTVSVEAGVLGCSIASSPTGWGPYACAAAGALLVSYDEAVDCAGGSTVSCVNVGFNVGASVGTAGAGHLFGRTVANRFRIAIDPAGTHLFPGGGRPAHVQLNWWIRGGPSDQYLKNVWRKPLPDSWPKWLHFEIKFR